MVHDKIKFPVPYNSYTHTTIWVPVPGFPNVITPALPNYHDNQQLVINNLQSLLDECNPYFQLSRDHWMLPSLILLQLARRDYLIGQWTSLNLDRHQLINMSSHSKKTNFSHLPVLLWSPSSSCTKTFHVVCKPDLAPISLLWRTYLELGLHVHCTWSWIGVTRTLPMTTCSCLASNIVYELYTCSLFWRVPEVHLC